MGGSGPHRRRAVHSHRADARRSRIHRPPSQRSISARRSCARLSQQTLHDRMPLLSNWSMEVGEATDDGDGSQLWLDASQLSISATCGSSL